MPVPLSEDVVALLRRPSTCYIATTMPDGSPQLTQTWVDTDGEHVLINSVESHQKTRNIARDPRVAVAVADPSEPASYVQIRGRVVSVTTEGAADHIEALAQKYLGGPYPWFGGRDQVRVIYVIEPRPDQQPARLMVATTGSPVPGFTSLNRQFSVRVWSVVEHHQVSETLGWAEQTVAVAA